MSRLVFGKKSSQLERPRVDRFMPPRESFTDERQRGSWRLNLHNETVDVWQSKHQKRKNYRNYLDEVFGLQAIPNKQNFGRDDENFLQPWPCAPRKKGYLSSADSILDLPNYSFAPFPELLDWSSKNMLVAALGRNYHMYSWSSQSVIGQGVTRFPIYCCKFDQKGDLLLIGSYANTVEIHDAELVKERDSICCPCFGIMRERTVCAITSVDWSPTGNSFITGCTRGTIVAYDRRTIMINCYRQLSSSPILAAKISPDSRYVAITSINSSHVQVLVWPSLTIHSIFKSNGIVKTISWHPWRTALLGLGVMSPDLQTTITMWDTPSSRVRETLFGPFSNCSLDVMLFSHRTGELVLSVWNSGQALSFPKTGAQLLVMADPYSVVDQSGDGRDRLDRVRTMVFSPDGSKLATATIEEDLIIWNFLPEDKKSKKTTKAKRFYAMPMYLDQCSDESLIR